MRARTLQLNKGHSSGQGSVHLIDDDYDIRTQLGALLRLLGYDVRTYADPMSFLETPDTDQPSVVILEMTMPQMSGLDVQKNLTQRRDSTAVVLFLSGNSDRRQIVQAMKAGADDFLWKPISREELEASIAKAMARSVERAARLSRLRTLRHGFALLSARERQLFELIIAGHQNRRIASHLNIRADTVKKHRAVICEKFLVAETADLIALARTVEGSDNLFALRPTDLASSA